VIHILHACLNQALAALGEKPARRVEDLHLAEEKGQLFFQDGTERSIERPKTQKFKRNITVGRKNTIASRKCAGRSTSQDPLLTPTVKARSMTRKSPMKRAGLPNGVSWLRIRFSGLALAKRDHAPTQEEARGKELTPEEKKATAKFQACASGRTRIGGVKRYRIVKRSIARPEKYFRDRVMELLRIAQFPLEFQTWHYSTDSIA